MKKHKLIFLLVLFSKLHTSAQTATEIAKTAISSTVSIIGLDRITQPLSYGSGFIIDDEFIATNIHVIEGSNSVYVLKNGEQTKYTVSGYVAIDYTNDLVILKVPNLHGTKINFGMQSFPEIGEKVYAVGNPKGLSGTFSEGIVSGIRDFKNNKVLQITSPISPGSSGGPVLNLAGQVIGIAFASFSSGQNLNFAIPIEYLINLKENLGATKSINKINATPRPSTKITVIPNIKEGVLVRNIHIGSNCEPAKIFFSIKNNLAYRVCDIKILFLIYDATGTVIDYDEDSYFPEYKNNPNDEYLAPYSGIKPYLARSVDNCELVAPEINWKTGYKVIYRVLNYKIIEE
ncbi:hypothetical protein BH11BAC5_BH11BAC5_50640 [soil metagenome]